MDLMEMDGRDVFHIISEATIGSNINIIWESVITGGIIAFIIISSRKEVVNQLVFLGILIIPAMLILVLVTYQGWHVGIISLTLFTYLIISNKINDSKLIKGFMIVLCCVQIYWTACSVIYDLKFNYSGSKKAAEFLKEKVEDKIVYGISYPCTAIQPYFPKNLYKNRDYDKAFFFWRKQVENYEIDKIKENNADIYIIPLIYEEFVSTLLNKNDFTEYKFSGHTYIKDEIYESESYSIWIRK